MAMVIILNQQCACLRPRYHRPGGTSMMACGNIINEDKDFGTLESRNIPLLPLPIFYRMPFVCVSSCQKKKFNKAMIIFSTNKKNTEKKKWKKIVCKKMTVQKMFVETYMF